MAALVKVRVNHIGDPKKQIGYLVLDTNHPLGAYYAAYCTYGGKTKALGGSNCKAIAVRSVQEAWDKALNAPTNLSEIGF